MTPNKLYKGKIYTISDLRFLLMDCIKNGRFIASSVEQACVFLYTVFSPNALKGRNKRRKKWLKKRRNKKNHTRDTNKFLKIIK